MTDINLTAARARLLREITTGRSAHKEMYGKRSFAASPAGHGCSTDVTRIIAPLYAANLIRPENNHNGWRIGWAPTDAGIAALAAYDAANPTNGA
jgi:hypothetical protein